jgi:hypothetical protein
MRTGRDVIDRWQSFVHAVFFNSPTKAAIVGKTWSFPDFPPPFNNTDPHHGWWDPSLLIETFKRISLNLTDGNGLRLIKRGDCARITHRLDSK